MAHEVVGHSSLMLRCHFPVPVNETCTSGVNGSLLVIFSVAERAPTAFGANLALAEQLAPTANDVPQLVVKVKSAGFAPPSAKARLVMGTAPAFLTVIAVPLKLVVPTVKPPNASARGDTAMESALTVWGAPADAEPVKLASPA